MITNSNWLNINGLALVYEWWKTYLNLEPLAQACSRRPAAFESKSEWKWPARSNAPTPDSLSSSPLLHPHHKERQTEQPVKNVPRDGGGELSYIYTEPEI